MGASAPIPSLSTTKDTRLERTSSLASATAPLIGPVGTREGTIIKIFDSRTVSRIAMLKQFPDAMSLTEPDSDIRDEWRKGGAQHACPRYTSQDNSFGRAC